MKKKRALIVVNLAGFIHFLWNDIATLQTMGYEVSIASNGKLADGSDAVELSKFEELRLQHYQIDFNTKSPLEKQNWTAFKQLCKILKNKYDLIHCHTPIAGILTRLAAVGSRIRGTKVIYTTHGFTFTDRAPRMDWLVYYTVEKIMSLFCDAIITINHEDYGNAKRMFCKNVYIIPSVGLDNKRFKLTDFDRDSYRQSIGVDHDDVMVLVVGELSERKNQSVVVKAIGRLPNKEKYNLVICGHAIVDSTMHEDLLKLAGKLGVRVQMLGHRLDMPEINNCADIAVIASLREGFGMAGVEAMSCGVPVVGSDVQGIREYVENGVTGYLCDPTDACSFAEGIHKADSMADDETLRMQDACREMAMSFDVSRSVAAMRRIYTEVIGEGR